MYTTLLVLVTLACVSFGAVVELRKPRGELRVSNALVNATKMVYRHRREIALVNDKSKHDVTAAERVAALNKHNEYRRNVQPAASDMQYMIWNWELEDMAQEWADTCQSSHGQPNRANVPYEHIGQNLWMHTGGHSIEKAVKDWYDEVTLYTYSSNSCTGTCGHYTQVVWATSSAVGCGIAYCDKIKGWNDKEGYIIVCNYGPAGNWDGVLPYKQGEQCTACPDSLKCPTFDDPGEMLCREDPECKSKVCFNAGSTSLGTCECDCMPPFSGSSCEKGPPTEPPPTTPTTSPTTDSITTSPTIDSIKTSPTTDNSTATSPTTDDSKTTSPTNDSTTTTTDDSTTTTTTTTDDSTTTTTTTTDDSTTTTTTTTDNSTTTTTTTTDDSTTTSTMDSSKRKVSEVPGYIGFEMTFVLPDRKFDPLLEDYNSDVYKELQRTIIELIMQMANLKSTKVYAVRKIKFIKGSVVVKLEIVTSKNATTDDVRDILQAIATNNSTLAIDEKSISVAEPVGINSSEEHVDPCISHPCQNRGNCIDLTTRYNCVCSTGFSGTHCEKKATKMDGWPCIGGRCLITELEKLRHKLNSQSDHTVKAVFIIVCIILIMVLVALVCLVIAKCNAGDE